MCVHERPAASAGIRNKSLTEPRLLLGCQRARRSHAAHAACTLGGARRRDLQRKRRRCAMRRLLLHAVLARRAEA